MTCGGGHRHVEFLGVPSDPSMQPLQLQHCALATLRYGPRRYVHSRAGPQGGGGGGPGSKASGDLEAGVEAERRYGRLYDEGINPFKEFKEQQKERQKSSMGFVDKVRHARARKLTSFVAATGVAVKSCLSVVASSSQLVLDL